MKKIISVLLICICTYSNAQNWRIQHLIKQLNNEQFIINTEAKAWFSYKSKSADKLIRIGKPATEQLITALNDKNKAIMVQLVLCNIWFGKATFAGPKEKLSEEKVILQYYLGNEKGKGMIIESLKNNRNKLEVRESEIESMVNFWKEVSSKK